MHEDVGVVVEHVVGVALVDRPEVLEDRGPVLAVCRRSGIAVVPGHHALNCVH
jgi:hypothetical protein